VWNLDEHTRPIARARVSAGGAAMLEIFQNLNTLGDYVMGFFVFEVRNKANSACVMVQGPVIQAFACVSFCFGPQCHISLPPNHPDYTPSLRDIVTLWRSLRASPERLLWLESVRV
jgi:hypothetical protein